MDPKGRNTEDEEEEEEKQVGEKCCTVQSSPNRVIHQNEFIEHDTKVQSKRKKPEGSCPRIRRIET